jgi:hypothetical protein
LRVAPGKHTPSVARLGRWTPGAARRCAPLLAALDEYTRPRVRQAVPDEIFVRRKPLLMVVGPGSLCWVSGRLAPRREGATRAGEFAQLPALEQVTKDGGTGLAKGLEQLCCKTGRWMPGSPPAQPGSRPHPPCPVAGGRSQATQGACQQGVTASNLPATYPPKVAGTPRRVGRGPAPPLVPKAFCNKARRAPAPCQIGRGTRGPRYFPRPP